jgi:hypothetical protein
MTLGRSLVSSPAARPGCCGAALDPDRGGLRR